MKVSLIIPNYNTWSLVKKNIDSSIFFSDAFIYEIIVIDDFSTIENNYIFHHKVRILRNEKNLHYTKSVNIGLRESKGDIIILLDSDAYPINNYIPYLIDLYKNNIILGCVGFKTIDEFGNDTGNVSNIPSVYSLIFGQKLYSLIPHFIKYSKNKPQYPFSCAVSFRRTCIEEVGFFDENFPVLEADNDLSFRINSSKWELVYDEKIIVYHTGGNSISKDYKRVLLWYEYLWKFLNKNTKIYFPKIVLLLVILRLYFELFILLLLNMFNSTPLISQKVYGRTLLIRKVKQYILN
jgi:GT2 family glycosyltransferase